MAKLCVECGKEIKEEIGSLYCAKCDDMLDRQFKSILDKIIINLELAENEITILNKFAKEDIIKLYLKVYKIFKEEGDFTKDQARVLNQILKTFNISENEVGKDFTSFFDIEEKRCPYCSAETSGFTKTCGKCGKDLTGFFDNTVLFHSVINNNEEKRIKEVKSRHGCLMAWLILIIIMNSAVALMYLINPLRRGMISQILPNVPVWVSIVSIVISIFIVVCAIALLLWKKWGFWGICATSVVSLIVNLSVGSSGIGQVLFSVFNCLLGVVLLFGVLHIGKKENKGWPQLK